MQKMLNIKGLIRTESEYEDACERVYDLMQSEMTEGTPEANEFQLLTLLIEEYEKINYSIPPPHPIDAIKFQLEQLGIDESELTKIFGSNSQKSEILSGKRKLNLTMIRKLHEQFKIPAETLIAIY